MSEVIYTGYTVHVSKDWQVDQVDQVLEFSVFRVSDGALMYRAGVTTRDAGGRFSFDIGCQIIGACRVECAVARQIEKIANLERTVIDSGVRSDLRSLAVKVAEEHQARLRAEAALLNDHQLLHEARQAVLYMSGRGMEGLAARLQSRMDEIEKADEAEEVEKTLDQVEELEDRALRAEARVEKLERVLEELREWFRAGPCAFESEPQKAYVRGHYASRVTTITEALRNQEGGEGE